KSPSLEHKERDKQNSRTTPACSDIAIIGMTGQFPGAKNVEEFRRNLEAGVESISFFTDEELLDAGIDAEILKHPNYVKAGGVLENIDLFDASFFGFNPREAEIMDPQQRVFLETAWKLLEETGYSSETYKGSIGVYAGVSVNGYLFNIYSNPALRDSMGDFQIGMGNEKDFLATRVSYKLDLKGPAFTVQTACSTSLTAVHL